MSNFIHILKDYWFLIVPSFTFFIAIIYFIIALIEGIKCTLRNDILAIYTSTKEKQQITTYQLEAVHKSEALYKKLKGNSFVEEIVNKMNKFKIIN